MANLPVVIFQFALSPYKNWQQLAWSGALLDHPDHPDAEHHRAHRRLGAESGRRASSDERSTAASSGAASGRPAPGHPKVRGPAPGFLLRPDAGPEGHQPARCRDRSITAFIGPSGCGKSTLLRVFNRMYALYPGHRATGEVLLDGENILAPTVDVAQSALSGGHGVPESRRRFRCRYSTTSRSDCGWRGASPRRELAERVEAALRDAAMWDEVKDKLHEDGRGLSGGQQQRLCIARTIALRARSRDPVR